ncbi:Pc23g00620 [Penicillium rubens Wisconsin 54-1255]|uniref:Pc23g00620 protein n=4 Tax=Penicillium TaxID=5073 RepID=B6HWB2_PENRW|nr:Pc23g00620 [Penicillium rubens Wisconsin 54-1255]CDM32813.1 Oligopeptide transporter [Penicillium roqueforti FM164]CRL31533.1 Major facilitator superfamily, general substrate transporter [Penicillium camemberti]
MKNREAQSVSMSSPTLQGRIATEDEIRDLQHVPAHLPKRVWLAATIGMAERFAYYGTQTLFQNYLQNKPTDLVPGAMGLGKSTATTVNLAFTVLVNILPLPTSVLVDGVLGRYRSLQIFTCIYAVGSTVLFATSFPSEMKTGISTPGFVVGAILIALGLGGVQASIQPFIADQYTESDMRIRTNKQGQKVVEDRELTIQYIYNVYYWMVNVGSLGSVATTLMEKYIGFWSAYLLDLCAVAICVLVVQVARPKFVHPPIQGSKLPLAARCLWCAAKGGFKLDAALPEKQLEVHGRVVPWDEEFIAELRGALSAFKICIGWPIFWVCMGEGSQVSISQAGQMETHGIPNDLIKSANPVAYVLFGVIVQKQLYPFLQKRKIVFSPVNRITLGFAIMAIAMAYSAVVQNAIYQAGPCYSRPLACDASQGGQIPNHVHVLLQLPTFVIIAIAEVFCWPTGSEYTYSHAPKSMKSILQACYIGTAGLGYLLGMALSPLAKDPLLVVLWSLVAGMMFLTACAFRVAFRKY